MRDTRPAQFKTLPQAQTARKAAPSARYEVTSFLELLFTQKKQGDFLDIPVSGGDSLKAEVLELVRRNPNVILAKLQAVNYHHSRINIFRKTDKGETSYVGHLTHPAFSDGLVLKQHEGKYYFVVEQQQNIIGD